MSAGRRIIVALLAAIVLLALATVGGMRWAGVWLARADDAVAAEAIVVLSGEPFRVRYAADLFKAGYAPRVLVSRPARYPREKMLDELGVPFPRAEDVYTQVLVKLGVPAERIAVFGTESISTVDEALALQQSSPGARTRLLVVTSPYHARRTKMIFRDYLPDADVRVLITPYEPYPERWWQSQDTARNVLLELAKIAYYLVGGRFSAAL